MGYKNTYSELLLRATPILLSFVSLKLSNSRIWCQKLHIHMRIMLNPCRTNRACCRSNRVKFKPLRMLREYFSHTMDRRVVAKWKNSISATKKVGLDIVESLSVEMIWSSTTLGFRSSSETSVSIASSSESSCFSSVSRLATISNNVEKSCLIFPLYGPCPRKHTILKHQLQKFKNAKMSCTSSSTSSLVCQTLLIWALYAPAKVAVWWIHSQNAVSQGCL